MKPIGGYFELELSKGEQQYHTTPFTFKSGRSSLQYILDVVKPSLVYIPFYTCNALIHPFETSGTDYQFYEVNDVMEPKDLPVLKECELFLYVNYFDVKRNTVYKLSALYGEKLIVDCSQAFFMKGNGKSWYFNSCRKFFGVPDGSFLYAPDGINLKKALIKNEDYYFEHLLKRFNGDPNGGYDIFVKNEISCGPEFRSMSKLSEYLLSYVDYDKVIEKRKCNFSYVHKAVSRWNNLQFSIDAECVPMCYPFLPESVINKENLFSEGIYIPTFWKDVLNRSSAGYRVERKFARMLVPLPVDHRYDTDDLEQLFKTLKYNHDLFCLPETS